MRLSLANLLGSVFTVFAVVSRTGICDVRSRDARDAEYIATPSDACLEQVPPDTTSIADPVSDATRAAALLQRQIGKPSRVAAPHESRSAKQLVGSKVPLTEQDFKLIMGSSNKDEKQVFVGRVASRLGLGAPSKTKLREWMPVIDKKVRNQPTFNLNTLIAFIRKDLREPNNKPFNREPLRSPTSFVDKTRVESEAWIRKALREQNIKPFNREPRRSPASFVDKTSMESEASANGKDMERNIAKRQTGREAHESKEVKRNQVASLMDIVLRAPLDEKGYMSVAALRNQRTMERYIRRAISARKLKVKDEGSLMGVIPYYSGKKATQSFAALTVEITKGATKKHPWLVPKDV